MVARVRDIQFAGRGRNALRFVERGIRSRLRVGDTEYAYERSVPVRGHSAILPEAITQFQSEGQQVLIAERNDRYFVYLASS